LFNKLLEFYTYRQHSLFPFNIVHNSYQVGANNARALNDLKDLLRINEIHIWFGIPQWIN